LEWIAGRSRGKAIELMHENTKIMSNMGVAINT
jgi:hypothetical protein